jgi:radical SAM/Cys-rich protein
MFLTQLSRTGLISSRPLKPNTCSILRCISSTSPSTSLIPETLRQMSEDEDKNQELMKQRRSRPSIHERKQIRRSLDFLETIPSFSEYLRLNNFSLQRNSIRVLQMNITRYCNQACNHCHVESSPKRTEFMSNEIFDKCFTLLEKSPQITTVDITGGAPEFHPNFRTFISKIRSNPNISKDLVIISRCNLTVMLEPDQEDLAQFYRDHRVRIVASLPCYSSKNVNQQRGANVFERSIEALKRLNGVGYSHDDSLKLDLVYNPSGAFLPPSQTLLEKQYKEILMADHGIAFNSLLTLTNMPIKRFADQLHAAGKLTEYMTLLVNHFNPAALQGVMCRETLSIDWNGLIYDCDFNQQLDLKVERPQTVSSAAPSVAMAPVAIQDLVSVDDLREIPIKVDRHCYGCTAGAGSSCQGAVV